MRYNLDYLNLIFTNEYNDLLTDLQDWLLVLQIVIKKVYNISLTWYEMLFGILGLFTILAISGKILIDLGIVKYNAELGNKQNPQIMEILRHVKKK